MRPRDSQQIVASYPHEPSCPQCWYAKVCNLCGEAGGQNICTNGRCYKCHREHCALGGDKAPGHGVGIAPKTRHFVQTGRAL